MEIYVDLNGNDSNIGSIERPLYSIEEALGRADNADTTILIRGGRYFFDKSVILNNGQKNITVKAYKNEKVYFDGGVVVDTKYVRKCTDEDILNRIVDKEARNHIVEIDISEYGIDYAKYGMRGFRRAYVPSGNELFIDAVPMIVARYPNEGFIPLTKVIDPGSCPVERDYSLRGGTICYDDNRCDAWEKAEDFYISGLFNWCFADDTIEVEKIDIKNKTIKTKMPHLAGFRADTFTNWRAINLLEEIDMEGEYYISPDKKRIYLYTDKNICNSVIQVSVMQDPLVMLCGVENICFDGIIFENSRGSGAYIEGGKNCVFKNCTFRNLGMVGVQVGQGATPLPEGRHTAHGEWAEDLAKPENMSGMPGCWQEMLYRYAAWNNNGGKNNGLQSCTIYNTGAGGVLLGGGDRKTLTAAGNYVENCEIFNVNRLDKSYRAGIDISGVGNKISHCDMYDMTGFAILIHGNDHIIEYNKIHDVIKNVADAGAIYMGRDLSEVGNKIQYNFIYDLVGNVDSAMGVCAVYFDDYCSFNEVYGNYFYNIRQNYDSNSFGVVFWNRGGQTSVANNIFIDCPVYIRPMLNGADGLHDILRNPGNKSEQLIADRATAKEDDYTGVDITSEVYRNKYPYLFAVYNGTYKNALMYWNNPVIYGKKDCFVNPEELNFTVKPDSDRFKQIEMVNVVDVIRNVNNEHKKFEVVDFGKIGPQKEHR